MFMKYLFWCKNMYFHNIYNNNGKSKFFPGYTPKKNTYLYLAANPSSSLSNAVSSGKLIMGCCGRSG